MTPGRLQATSPIKPTPSGFTTIGSGTPLSSDCTQLDDDNVNIVWSNGGQITDTVVTTSLKTIFPNRVWSQTTSNFQPKTQALQHGGSIDVWTRADASGLHVVYLRKDPYNRPVGKITRAFPYLTGNHANADITRLMGGRIVISCTSGQFPIQQGVEGPGVFYQGFTPGMVPSFNGTAYGIHKGPHQNGVLAATNDGGFLAGVSASGNIMIQKISALNKKIGDPLQANANSREWCYHPSLTVNGHATTAAWAVTNTSYNKINEYVYTTISNMSASPEKTLSVPKPGIAWTKNWEGFQNFFQILSNARNGTVFLPRCQSSIFQITPSLGKNKLATDPSPTLGVSGCTLKNGWMALISTRTKLIAQACLFPPITPSPTLSPTHSPTPFPSTQPTSPPTNAPTPFPTGQQTPYPTNAPTLSPTFSPPPAPYNPPADTPDGLGENQLYAILFSTLCITGTLLAILTAVVGYRKCNDIRKAKNKRRHYVPLK